MRICVFIKELTIGGAEKQSMYLCKIIQKKYKTYYVVLYDNYIEDKYLKFIKKNKINVTFLKGDIFKKIYSYTKFLKRNKIDIIFSFLFSTNVIGTIAGKIAGVPYIIGGIRNCVIVKKKLLISKLLHNYFLKYSIFNSYSGKNNLAEKGLNPEKSIVIPNCFDFNLPLKNKAGSSNVNILTVARFMPQKDYHTSIKSIGYLLNELLNDTKYKIQYYIVGYGKGENRIKEYIKSMKLENNISVIYKPDDLGKYYDIADIYLSTSLYEGLSNSIMEAMHNSLPVVATDVGDNNKLVKDGINGYLSQTGDFKSISNSLYTLIIDPSKRSEFGEASYNELQNNYSSKQFQRKYFELIENLKS